jgi:hypothetical protein
VAGREYERPTTGVSITHGNSESGALPTREPAHGEDHDNAEQWPGLGQVGDCHRRFGLRFCQRTATAQK